MTASTRAAPFALPTLLRLAVQQLRGRRAGASRPMAPDTFRQRVNTAISDQDALLHWAELPAGSADWTHVASLPAGSHCTLLACGRVALSRALGIGAGPKAALWYRLDGGPAHKIRDDAQNLYTAQGAKLELIATIPGEFSSENGHFGSDVPRANVSGALLAAVVVWQDDGGAGLRAAAAREPALFAAATASEAATPPGDWRYLWRLGEGRIYAPCQDEDETLCCHTDGDVGILQHPVSAPLDEELRLSWQWLAERLPSTLPEHTQPTHDYLSIAVEFDNGLDLTYMWSAALAIDTVFRCPLSWWDQRETHWVIRNNPEELGRWLSEERTLLADYRAAIGGTPPARVVGVWLIANSLFQGGVGACRYREIALLDASGKRTPVPIAR